MSVVTDYTALISGSSWTGGPAGQAVVLTYSFSGTATSYLQSSNAAAAASFTPLNDAEKTTVRAALAQWAAVSGITFYETTATPGDLTFGVYNLSTMGQTGEAGLGNYPSTGNLLDASGNPQIYGNFLTQGGDVYFDTSYQTNPAYSTDFAHVAIHEIGHALGLKHPFDTPGNTLDPALDNGSQTVMAYAGLRSPTLGPLDIAAIQALYGTRSGAAHPFAETWNPATESLTEIGTAAAQLMFGSGGDDVFYSNGGNDAISGGEGDDIIYANGTPISVNGGPGLDTVVTGLTYSAQSTIIGGTGTFRYLSAGAGVQQYAAVERLDFINGVYDLTTNTFGAVQPGTYTWTGDVNAAWSTPGNWKALRGGSAALAPGAADSVTINAAATVMGGGTAASLNLVGSPTLAGAYVVGRLSGGSATTTLQAGTSLAVTGSLDLAGGLITVAGASTVLEVGGRGYAVGGSGTLELDAGSLLSGYGTINANTIDNLGTIQAAGGTLRLIGTQGAGFPGTSQIGAGATLWVQNLHGSYSFQGAGAQLRVDTPAFPLSLVPTLTGFAAGNRLVLSGTSATAAYVATGPSIGTLSAGGMSMTLLGDYSQSAFSTVTDAASSTTTVTVGPKPPPVTDPLFDAAFYLARNPDVRAAGVDPYTHYMTMGWKEGRDPSALFSTSFYLNQNPDVKAAGLNPLMHYEQFGFREGRSPDAFFDDSYYLTQNPDVQAAGVNPLLHFLQSGWSEGREPSLLFSDAKYLAANPDVRAAGINPLLHYITNGQAEGRLAALTGPAAPADPLVNAAFYDRQLGATLLPTGIAAAQQAAASYDATGWQKGLNPNAWFSTSYYLSHNPDVASAHIDPLLHYENFGWKEGRDPSAVFSTTRYLTAYADVKAAGLDPLLHFVAYGQGEGRTAFTV